MNVGEGGRLTLAVLAVAVHNRSVQDSASTGMQRGVLSVSPLTLLNAYGLIGLCYAAKSERFGFWAQRKKL